MEVSSIAILLAEQLRLMDRTGGGLVFFFGRLRCILACCFSCRTIVMNLCFKHTILLLLSSHMDYEDEKSLLGGRGEINGWDTGKGMNGGRKTKER